MIKREFKKLLDEYLLFFPVVAIVGSRQCGKTTLSHELDSSWKFYDLEKGSDFDVISRDPDLFLRMNQNKIVLDEAQLLPELFSALRVAVDSDRSTKGRYLITGPSSPELLSSISESLVGRIGIIEMSPLSITEAYGKTEYSNRFSEIFESKSPAEVISQLKPLTDLHEIHDYWFQGGYPELWVEKNQRFNELWYPQYIQTFVNRDLKRHFPKIDDQRFRLFLQMLSGLSGEVVNYSDVARNLGVSQPTVRDYFNIAHHTFVWRMLWPFEKNVQKQIIKHPKGYLRDSGLLHHHMKLKNLDDLLVHPKMGNSWEGMIIEQVLRGLDAKGIYYTPYHYRTKGGSEIDLVLEGPFGIIPIEIKYSSRLKKNSLKGVEQFCADHDLPIGIIINNEDKVNWYTDKIVGVPMSYTL